MKQSLFTSRLRRCLAVVSAVVVSVAIFVSSAAADQPMKDEFIWTDGTDLTGVCSIPVHVESSFDATYTVFFDADGGVTRGHMHMTEQDTFSANGKTLVGLPYTFNGTANLDSDGNITQLFWNGVIAKVPLPDGKLFISAGRIDVTAHGYPGYILLVDKGKSGNVAAFCAALE
jgi:hypothetical protein